MRGSKRGQQDNEKGELDGRNIVREKVQTIQLRDGDRRKKRDGKRESCDDEREHPVERVHQAEASQATLHYASNSESLAE